MSWVVALRSRLIRCGAILAVLPAVLVACGTDGARLLNNSGVGGECQSAVTDEQWQRLMTTSTAFGLDYFRLSPSHGSIKVTKVELIDPSAGFTLTHADFIPDGGVGNGAPWGSPHAAAPAYVEPLRRSAPTELSFAPKPPGASEDYNGAVWQITVGVSIDAQAAAVGGGYAKGVRVTYRSGGGLHTVDGNDPVAVLRNHDDCLKHL